MTATRSTAPALAAALTLLLCSTGVAAQSIGPSLADLPAAQQPARSPESVEADLAAFDAALGDAIARSDPGTTPAHASGTPLGQGARSVQPTPLIRELPGDRPARGGLTQTVLALAGVLLLVLALATVFRRVARVSGGLSGSLGAGGRAPAGVLEVLARYPLASRHTLVVLRFDRRVLLCSMTGNSRSSGAGMNVLCELDSPEDVASVLIKTRDEAGESIARSFERSLREAEHAADGSLERPAIRVGRPATKAAPAYAHAAVGGRAHAPAAGGLRRGLETIWTGGKR